MLADLKLPPVNEIARTREHPVDARGYWRWEASDLRETAAWEFELAKRQPDLRAERLRSARYHVVGARQCLAAAVALRLAFPRMLP